MDSRGKADLQIVAIIALIVVFLYLAWPTIADKVPWGTNKLGGDASIVVTLHYEDGTSEILKDTKTITIYVGDKPISDISATLWMTASLSPAASGNYSVQYNVRVTLDSTSLQTSGPFTVTKTLGSSQSIVSAGADARDLEANMSIGETRDLKFRFYGSASCTDPEGQSHSAPYDISKTITVKRVATYTFSITPSVTTSTS